MTKPKISKAEAFRLAVLAQAEALNVPGFMTPLWQARYGKRD
jgi:hypothetical protein